MTGGTQDLAAAIAERWRDVDGLRERLVQAERSGEQLEQIAAWLDVIAPGPDGGLVLSWEDSFSRQGKRVVTVPDGQPRRWVRDENGKRVPEPVSFSSSRDAAAAIVRDGRGRNAFTATARFTDPERQEHALACVGGVPLDLDVKPGERQMLRVPGGDPIELPLASDATPAALVAHLFGGGRWTPTLVWRTGRGAQAILALDEPFRVATDDDRERIRRLVLGVNLAAAISLAELGLTTDVFDHAHHRTRLPWTWHRKPPLGLPKDSDPRAWPMLPAMPVFDQGPRHRIDDLERIVDDVLPPGWFEIHEQAKRRKGPRGTVSARPPSDPETGKLERLEKDADGVLVVPPGEGRKGLSADEEWNARVSLAAAATFAGWTRAGGDSWTKPGGSFGERHAAETIAHDGTRVLHVFSARAAPFQDGSSYSAFRLVAISLAPGRDAGIGCREFRERLRSHGFGTVAFRRVSRVEDDRERFEELARERARHAPSERSFQDITSTRSYIRERVADWFAGDRSLHLSGTPGTGKTTAAVEAIADRIEPGSLVVVALPTRELAHEKAIAARETIGRPGVQVVEVYGRTDDPWGLGFCADYGAAQWRLAHGFGGCQGCNYTELCAAEETHYIGHRKQLGVPPHAARIVFTTHAAVPGIVTQAKVSRLVIDDAGSLVASPGGLTIERTISHGARVAYLDALTAWLEREGLDTRDGPAALERWCAEREERPRRERERERAGKLFERIRERYQDRGETYARNLALDAFSGRLGLDVRDVERVWRWRGSTDALVDFAERFQEGLPPIGAAWIVERVFGASRLETALAQLADDLPRPEGAAVAWSEFRSQPIPWETDTPADAADGPRFWQLVIDALAFHERAGRWPRVERTVSRSDGSRVWMPNEALERLAVAGSVLWLDVQPMPAAMASAWKVNRRRFRFEPPNLEVVAVQTRRHERTLADGTRYLECDAHGAGQRKDGPSRADVRFRTILRQVVDRDRVGIVCHKADRDALELEPTNARVAYFGRDHASTDRLANCATLLVRRFALPPAETLREARILAQTLGLHEPSTDRGTDLRRWGLTQITELSDRTELPVAVGAALDMLVAELEENHRRAALENAIGRVRAAAHGKRRRVFLFDGRPVPGIGVSRVVDERELAGELAVQVEPTADQVEQEGAAERVVAEARKAERLERLATLLEQNPDASRERLAAELGCSVRTIKLDLAAVGRADPVERAMRGLWTDPLARLGLVIDAAGFVRGAPGDFPLPHGLALIDAVQRSARRAGRGEIADRTIRSAARRIDDWIHGVGPMPTAGRGRRAFLDVSSAFVDALERARPPMRAAAGAELTTTTRTSDATTTRDPSDDPRTSLERVRPWPTLAIRDPDREARPRPPSLAGVHPPPGTMRGLERSARP